MTLAVLQITQCWIMETRVNVLEKDNRAKGHKQVWETIKYLPEGTTEKDEWPKSQ
jgi:hypothetical protein